MTAVVVAGASLTGLRAAEELRARGFDGTITIVGEERHLPYDRPPLSKQVLAGAWDAERIACTVVGDTGLDGLGIDWRLGVRAEDLDVAGRSLGLDTGEKLPFDGLVIATGAVPRRLPGTAELAGVHVLRTLDDALALRAALDAGASRVVVVGGGFIGAEVAATCRARGAEVTLLEALDVPLGRVLGDEVGTVIADLHRAHGVDVRLGVAVAGLMPGPEDVAGLAPAVQEGGGRLRSVRLADGGEIAADLVVVGIGVAPATGWLAGSGLPLDDGVVCDETTLVAPGIVAAGDVARWPSRRFGELLRVEHWDNAVTMGAHAGRRLLADLAGEPGEPYDPVPWFWSDQYDRKIQLTGRSCPADEVRVVDGALADRRFVALYRRHDRIVGAVAMNRPRLLMTCRSLVERGAPWREALAELGAA